MTIQWFPGHMTRAKRQMQEAIKTVDMVIEIRDSRIPNASKNPMIDQLIQNKPRLILLSKKDKGDLSEYAMIALLFYDEKYGANKGGPIHPRHAATPFRSIE